MGSVFLSPIPIVMKCSVRVLCKSGRIFLSLCTGSWCKRFNNNTITCTSMKKQRSVLKLVKSYGWVKIDLDP